MNAKEVGGICYVRSNSSKSLRGVNPYRVKGRWKGSLNCSRDSLNEGSRIMKGQQEFQFVDHVAGFIRPKPSHHPLKISNSQNPTPRPPLCSETFQPQPPSSLQQILLKFSLKSIETLKKDFTNHETLYTHFLGILSEIDEIFENNQLLQFSHSRAREVFKLYLSRPGQVLLTLKNLPKLLTRIKLSKKIQSQTRLVLKHIDRSKLVGEAKNVYDLVVEILLTQKKDFTGKEIKNNGERRVKTYENLVTDDRTFDISIMDLQTVPNESENRSASPIQCCDSEESSEFLMFTLKDDKRTTKSKLIEKLYSKMNGVNTENLNSESFRLATFGNGDGNKEGTVLKSDSKENRVPGYMRALKRAESEKRAGKIFKCKENSKKLEWEEVRMVKIIQRKKIEEQRKKCELVQEIRRKQQEKLEMQTYVMAKEKSEKLEINLFKEEERKEIRRIKQTEKLKNYTEMIDEIERNKLKSRINK